MARVTKATTKKAAPAKKAAAAKTAVKKAVVKKAAPAAKSATSAKKVVAKKAVVRRAGGAPKTEKPPVKKATAAPKAPAVAKAPAAKAPAKPPAKRKVVLDKFGLEQKQLLEEERVRLTAQAQELRAEADQLAAEREPGDVQFDEESGEGGTTNIDRERDLALSMQATIEVEEIDLALAKLLAGTYGACERCGQAIPKARLKAIPQARLCIACKSGGLSRR